jgi:hypothetical protein
MTVKIDMEMPKACRVCDLAYIDADTSKLICSYNDCPASYTDRLKCCPLQKINNELPRNSACFDCAHTATCLWLKKHGPCYSCGSKKVKE